MSITFSSCFYVMKSKVEPTQYMEWINNFISIVNNFNLVIYTDEISKCYIDTKNNPKIKIIIKHIEDFYCYKYKEYWLLNHSKNYSINSITSWKLNMLWSEKINFVRETIYNKYFDTEFYGWCDIGYFRNRKNDTNTLFLKNWPNQDKIMNLKKNKIIYGCINNCYKYLNQLSNIINNKNDKGLPIQEIPSNQYSISGGFFILHKTNIKNWMELYYQKLELYFNNNYLVKDDQIILADCIFSKSNLDKFVLCREKSYEYDNWFMFQRILN